MGIIRAIVAKVTKKEMKPAAQSSVQTDGDFVRDKVMATLRNTPEIPVARHNQIAETVLRNPRDLHSIAILIEDLELTKSKRGAIAHTLGQTASTFASIHRQLDLGIEKAAWRHSGAPCKASLDETHRSLDGKIYLLTEGLLVDGRYVWPGIEEGCRCTSTPVLPF